MGVEVDQAGVVSDMRMPGLHGLDLVKLIRRKLDGIPIVLISGDPTTAPTESIADAQVPRVLTKPFSPSELLETSRRVVSE